MYALRLSHLCSRHSFNDVTRISFRFRLLVTWSSSHGRDALSHIIRCKYIYTLRSYWHFSEIQGLDFQVMWIWPFRHVDSAVFELCAKFGSNIWYSYWDRRTCASNDHIMTSRELTSGFDFWSRCHLRMAVTYLFIKFGVYIFIQSEVIGIFFRN